MTYQDEAEIKSLVMRERFARDTAQWTKLRESYHPDASKTNVHTIWHNGDIDEFIAASQKLHTRAGDIIHNLIPADVQIHGDKAIVDSWCIIAARLTVNESEVELDTSMRLLYRCLKVDGQWKLLSLQPIYIRDKVSSVPPALPLDLPDLSKFRKSYRFTAWMVSQRGLVISDDLPGEDEPKTAQDMYAKHQEWVRSGDS